MPNAVLRRVAVHDRYQLELKLGYPLTPGKATRYRIDTYVFAPHSLGINEMSYPRNEFYRDIQHYMRMKTPQLRLDQLAGNPTSPLSQSEQTLATCGGKLDDRAVQRLGDNFRLLRAMLKSAAESWLAPLLYAPPAPTAESAAEGERTLALLVTEFTTILSHYRQLAPRLAAANAPGELIHAYRLTDESISVLVEDLLLRAHELAPGWLPPPAATTWQARLVTQIQAEMEYRKSQDYPSVLSKQSADDYLLRVSALKKFTSSVLWLTTSTRREGTTLEQFLFASAAGVSMIFATLVAFYAQAVYGQFTAPVFLALVIAYMFKDRIKEQGRAVSSHLLSRHLFDYRTKVQTHDGRHALGQVREKVSHLPYGAVPAVILQTRVAGPFGDVAFTGNPESVIHYVKLVELRRNAASFLGADRPPITAINDIMRLDVRPFLRKMDDPYQERLVVKGNQVRRVRCHRTYHLNLVSVFQAEDGAATYERTLLVLDRKGIRHIEQYDAHGAPAASVAAISHVDDLADTEYHS